MSASAVKAIAGIFALAAFAVAIIAGVASRNPASAVLVRAMIAMILCYPVGLAAGLVVRRIAADQIEGHRRANPLPAQTLPGASAESPENPAESAQDARSAPPAVERAAREERAAVERSPVY
jgi:hypothetical protein